MKQVYLTIAIVLLGIVAIGISTQFYFASFEPGVSALNAEVQKLQLQAKIEGLKNARQDAAIAFQLKKTEVEQLTEVRNTKPVRASLMIALSTKILWPVWILIGLAGTGALLAYSRQQTTVQKVAEAQQAGFMLAEEHTAKVVERVIPAYARILAKQKPEPILEAVIEPEALPAFTGNVHFSQAALDNDYEAGNVLLGRNMETGGVCQIGLDDLQSLTINGLQKQGKSVLLLSIIHAALYQKYILDNDVTIVLIDVHAEMRDSLVTRLNDFIPGVKSLFDKVFDGENCINTELPAYLDSLIEKGKSGAANAIALVVFNEYTESVANLDEGKAIEQRVKRLFNYRKAGIYMALAMFEGGKNAQSSKGLNVSKMSVSKALFHTAKDEGSRFLTGGDEAATLGKGEYLLLLPGMAESERIKAPLFAAMDFQAFAQYVPATASEQVASERKEIEAGTQDKGLTPEIVRELMTESLSKTAKKAGIPKSTLSNYLNGKGSLTDDQSATLQAYLIPKTANIINLEQRRSALEKQA